MLERSEQLSCGKGSKDITGARIALYPMSDNYVEIILKSIVDTDMSKVWRHTDSLGTLLRGQMHDVINTSMNLFSNAYRENTHMTASLTFSKGCPGDTDADALSNVVSDFAWVRTPNDMKQCEATFSFYTFGREDYMSHIYQVIDLAKNKGIYSVKSHYSTVIEGSIFDIFELFEEVLQYADTHLSHFVIEANLSVNSPSQQKGESL